MNAICHYLEDKPQPTCTVDTGHYIATIFEFRDYRIEICMRDKHKTCPYFKKNKNVSAPNIGAVNCAKNT